MFEIGSSLREARLRQGLEITDFELRTKVRAKYLRALEEERFDQLPAHTYIKGFLRTYAEELGLDGQLYVDEYNSRFVSGEDEHASPLRARRAPQQARRRRDERESRVVAVALVAIGLLTALVIAAWKFGGADEPQVQGVNSGTVVSPTRRVAQTPQRRVVLEVKATKGASFMEVRLGSRAGAPLYSGTLERGQTHRFVRKGFYVSLASPANVLVRVNSNRVKMPAGGELTVPSASSSSS